MELPKNLQERVERELKTKLLSGGMSGNPAFKGLVETAIANRVNEIEGWLDHSVSPEDFKEFEEFVREDSPELTVALVVSEIYDPELAATVEAARNGKLDVEGIMSDITEGFEAAFRHYCGEQGLTTRTIELLLAHRQGQQAAAG